LPSEPSGSEFARINSYEFSRILNATVLPIAGLGILITVPEPATMAMLAIPAIAMLRRRR